ncbi:condensation domain-containing protein [Dactylosporangium matsuzakiense]|uniref:condensation domain-containing protein n=1 Tax=Dactylosporangium matsuzakiense TaxID=53360 RepID=UPI0022F3035A|nr:condensation domain-containing protein [Dactylosporangium matsuzakiense]
MLTWIETENPGHVGAPGFVAVAAYQVIGAVEAPAMQAALDDLVVQHRILSTELIHSHDGYRHQPTAAGPAPFRFVDAEAMRAPTPSGEVPQALLDAMHQPGALIGAVLGRHARDRHTLVLIASHATVDYWSLELLARDLTRAYDRRVHGTRPDPAAHQFERSAQAAYGRLDAGRVQRAQAYWRRLLADAPVVAAPSPAAGSFSAERRFDLRLDRADVALAASGAGTTPFVVLLTGYACALADVAGTGEVVVPLFTSGRARTDWETVGPFMNVVAARVDLRGDPSPKEALGRTHRAFVAALAHEVPLAALLSGQPHIAALFSASGTPVGGFELIQFPPPEPLPLPLARIPVGPRHGATVLPLSGLLCWLEADRPNGFAGTIRYRPGLFDSAWIDRLITHLTEHVHVLAGLRRDSAAAR